MTIEIPEIYALVGIPGSGKTEVQKILHRHFEIIPVDDFGPVRNLCGRLFDFSIEEMTEQHLKAEIVDVGGVEAPRRWFLGEMGALIEQRFGPLTIPRAAIREVLAEVEACNVLELKPSVGFCFASVRREQPKAYAEAGGLIIEIERPGVEPTGNTWDEYERTHIHFTIQNNGTLEELEAQVISLYPMWRETLIGFNKKNEEVSEDDAPC